MESQVKTGKCKGFVPVCITEWGSGMKAKQGAHVAVLLPCCPVYLLALQQVSPSFSSLNVSIAEAVGRGSAAADTFLGNHADYSHGCRSK